MTLHDNYIREFFQQWLIKNKANNADLLILKKAFTDGMLCGIEYKKQYTAEEYLQK